MSDDLEGLDDLGVLAWHGGRLEAYTAVAERGARAGWPSVLRVAVPMLSAAVDELTSMVKGQLQLTSPDVAARGDGLRSGLLEVLDLLPAGDRRADWQRFAERVRAERLAVEVAATDGVVVRLLRVGLNAAEVAALRWGDVDWLAGELVVSVRLVRHPTDTRPSRAGSCRPAACPGQLG